MRTISKALPAANIANVEAKGIFPQAARPAATPIMFGWHVITMDAHDFDSIDRAFAAADKVTDKPVAIIQKSVKGKGVSFMENQVGWHGTAPNKEQYDLAMAELSAQLKELED